MRLIINIVFIFSFNSLFSISEIEIFADKLYYDGLYEESAHEYKRAIFFDKTNSFLKIKLARSYRELKKFEESERIIKEYINSLESEDEKKYEATIELGITYIYAKNYAMATYQFLKVENFSEDIKLKKKALIYLTISYAVNYQWKETEEAFDRFISLTKNSNQTEIKNVKDHLMRAKSFKSKSKELAKWLSIFIFGAGQIYAGDIGSGINAMALNGFISFITLDSFLKGNYIDGIFLALSFLERYYSGNIYHAEEKVVEYNERENNKLLKDFINLIEPFTNH